MVSSILIDIVIPAKILGKCLTVSYKINKICHPTIPADLLSSGQLWVLFYKTSDLVLSLPLSRKNVGGLSCANKWNLCLSLGIKTYRHLVNQPLSLRAPTHLMQALFLGDQRTRCLPNLSKMACAGITLCFGCAVPFLGDYSSSLDTFQSCLVEWELSLQEFWSS